MKRTPVLLAEILLCVGLLGGTLLAGRAEPYCVPDERQSADGTEEKIRIGTFAEGLKEKLTAEKQQSEQIEKRQRELYGQKIEELEQLLSDHPRQQGEIYREYINSVYLFPESYHGGLRAEYAEGEARAFQIAVLGWETEEKQKYQCRLLADGSLWFTYQTENPCENDLPDYLVNEEVLRYDRADFVYDDGETDVEEVRKTHNEEIERYLAEEAEGEIQEFWSVQGRLYKIDREAEKFVDVSEEKESCIADFLWEQTKRIHCRVRVSADCIREVEKYKPEGYRLLWGINGWDEIAVCDLNHDGRMDYVVALYPEDYEKKIRQSEWFDPYEKLPEYYGAGFWLLLSLGDMPWENYMQIQLSDSIVYQDDSMTLVETAFTEEGILQLEYFVGRAPFCDICLRFWYDEEEQDFYIVGSGYREHNTFLKKAEEHYGRTNLYSFFTFPGKHYEYAGNLGTDVRMNDGNLLDFYSDRFQYRCENPLEEHRINSLIWEKEYELYEALKERYPGMEVEFSMETDPVFQNQKLVTGRVEVYGAVKGSYDFRTEMPILLDRQSGEYVTVTGLLEKEEFLQIFECWSEDAIFRGCMEEQEQRECRRRIAGYWEQADLVESYVGPEKERLILEMAEEGVRVVIWLEGGQREQHFMMDKEYFFGTEIWEYLKPERDR